METQYPTPGRGLYEFDVINYDHQRAEPFDTSALAGEGLGEVPRDLLGEWPSYGDVPCTAALESSPFRETAPRSEDTGPDPFPEPGTDSSDSEQIAAEAAAPDDAPAPGTEGGGSGGDVP